MDSEFMASSKRTEKLFTFRRHHRSYCIIRSSFEIEICPYCQFRREIIAIKFRLF